MNKISPVTPEIATETMRTRNNNLDSIIEEINEEILNRWDGNHVYVSIANGKQFIREINLAKEIFIKAGWEVLGGYLEGDLSFKVKVNKD